MSNTDFDEGGVEDGAVEALPDEDIGAEVEAGAEDETLVAGEAEGEQEGEQEEATDEEQPRSRRDGRIATLLERAETEKQRADQFAREIQEIRAEQQARRSQGESPEREAERLALMTPEERNDYKLNSALANMQRQQAFNQMRMEDLADQAAFNSKTQVDSLYKKYGPKVEAERINLMKQGQVVPREELLRWIVGREVIEARKGKGAEAQKRKGQENIRRQQTQPANGRADTRGTSRGPRDTPAKRLEGVLI